MRVKLVGLNEEMLEAVKGLEELIDFQLYNEKGSKNENLEIINVSKLPEESENVIEVLRGKNNETEAIIVFKIISMLNEYKLASLQFISSIS